MLIPLLSIMDVIGGGGAGAGGGGSRTSPEVAPKVIKELTKLLKAEKRKVIKVAKGTPIYRVEFPEYPRFEAKMHEFEANNDHAIAEVMRGMLKRQREQDDEEALYALIH